MFKLNGLKRFVWLLYSIIRYTKCKWGMDFGSKLGLKSDNSKNRDEED